MSDRLTAPHFLTICAPQGGSWPDTAARSRLQAGVSVPWAMPSAPAGLVSRLLSPQDAVSALLARTSAELLAVEQELAQEEEEEEEEQRAPDGDWCVPFAQAGPRAGALPSTSCLLFWGDTVRLGGCSWLCTQASLLRCLGTMWGAGD